MITSLKHTAGFLFIVLLFLPDSGRGAQANPFSIYQIDADHRADLNALVIKYPVWIRNMENLQADLVRFQNGESIRMEGKFARHNEVRAAAASLNDEVFKASIMLIPRPRSAFLTGTEQQEWNQLFIRASEIGTYLAELHGQIIALLLHSTWAPGVTTTSLPYDSGYNSAFTTPETARTYHALVATAKAGSEAFTQVLRNLESLSAQSLSRSQELQQQIQQTYRQHPGFFGASGYDFATLRVLDGPGARFLDVSEEMVSIGRQLTPAASRIRHLRDIRSVEDAEQIGKSGTLALEVGARALRLEKNVWEDIDTALAQAQIPDRDSIIEKLKDSTGVVTGLARIRRSAKALMSMGGILQRFGNLTAKNFHHWSSSQTSLNQEALRNRLYKFEDPSADAEYVHILDDLKAVERDFASENH